uniref:Uncharacterized protein n=1 Tax=Fagus sylvatica TaxID=28930 RepID=A0A2N9I2Q2_FAGSY
MAPCSRGVGAVFACTFPVKIPVKRGMLSANREFHVVAGVVIFPTHRGLAGQLAASRKDSAREGGSCAAYFCKVPDSWESELGFARYGPANRGHRSVFGPFEDIFPIKIPARPGKRLDDPESCMSCTCVSSFQRTRACGSTCCEPGRLCAQAQQRRRRSSMKTSAQPYFIDLFSCAWFQLADQVATGWKESAVLPITPSFLVRFRPVKYRIEALIMCSTYWLGGDQFDSAFVPVNGPVKPRSNLVNLGQTWSNLVDILQTSGKCIPGRVSRVFGHSGPQLGQEQLSQPLVKLGQSWSNLVNPSQIWSNFGKCVPDLLLGSISMWRALVGSGRLGSGCLVLRADTRENPGGKNGVMTVAPSLFGVSWHKGCQTKNKWLDFCPLRFSRFPYPSMVAVQFASVRVPVLSGSERTFQGLRRIGRGARRWFVARAGNSRVIITRDA